MHVFFDTTEVALGKGYTRGLGRIGSKRLHDSARALNSRLYVPDLVIEEVTFRRWRSLQEQFSRTKTVADALRPYATVQITNELPQETILSNLRDEFKALLHDIPVEIIPTAGVTLDEVLKLSVQRVPPFTGGDDPKGFHDAVILLSVLQYARLNRLDDVVFVSDDQDHSDVAIKQLASDYGIECELVRLTDSVVERMEHLRTAHLASMQDSTVKQATEYMSRHRSVVQEFLKQHPLTANDFRSHPFSFGVTEVLGFEVGTIEAIPDRVPRDGEECRLNLFIKAVADVLAQRAFETGFTTFVTDGPYGRQTTMTPPHLTGIYTSTAESAVPISRYGQHVELRGEATAQFERGVFLPPPTILALRPYSPEANTTNITNFTTSTTWRR